MATAQNALDVLRAAVEPWNGDAHDDARLLEIVGDRELVLIGEASHGTHEFYATRAHITQLLIEQKGFSAVAVEADWPDALRVNRFVRGDESDATAVAALGGFQRFPTWMWRNADVLDFIGWLRAWNAEAGLPVERAVGFYGVDIYSLYTSAQEVLRYLDRVDPAVARLARERYRCFEELGEADGARYGRASAYDALASCEEGVVAQLMDMQRRAPSWRRLDGAIAEDAYFFAEQNARLVRTAEEYYRTMFRGRRDGWNLRDEHMADTVDALMRHLSTRHARPKLVVWAHNSHLGDARAISEWRGRQWNVGQLVRERYGQGRVCIIGFSGHHGTVTAATDWDEPPLRRRVRPGHIGSYEALFHRVGVPRFLLRLGDDGPAVEELRTPRLQRAIGVIYMPETERYSHYYTVSLPDQFDVLLHFDETRAVEPLDVTHAFETHEPPETYPSML